jgi:hypothetical protein
MAYTKAQVKDLTQGVKTEGIVEVRLLDPKRTGTITVRGYNEIDQYGSHTWRELVDANGEERVIKVQRKMNLNLGSANDRLLYAHLKKHVHFVTGPSPLLELVDVEEQAGDFISHREIKSDAEAIVKSYSEEKLKDLARVLVIGVRENSSITVLKREIYSFIDLHDNTQQVSNAEKLVAEVNSEDYETKVLLRRAMAENVIRESLNRLMFGSISLGTSFESAVQWATDNKDLLAEVETALKNKK